MLTPAEHPLLAGDGQPKRGFAMIHGVGEGKRHDGIEPTQDRPSQNAMYETIKKLVAETRGSADFDRCCAALARALLSTFATSTEQRASLTRARALRVSVHLRSDDAYRNFAVTNGAGEPTQDVEMAPSASLWRLVRDRAAPVVLDVMLGEIDFTNDTAGAPLASGAVQPDTTTLLAESSRIRFSSRDASHVIALPLIGSQQCPFGMVCVEIQHRAAVGERNVFGARHIDDLRLLVDLLAPQLALQPAPQLGEDRHRTIAANDGIPVVGAKTQELYSYLRLFARQKETMLITGESGTGKSRLARWVHDRSQVSDGPFETFSMHGLNEDMQLAHLFGWRRGAFTGANDSQMGLIEAAKGGTLLIDEIDKLSLKAQSGLLDVLESGSYRRLGETRTRPVEVRFLIATNSNLRSAIDNGEFRADLYYRISVLPVMMPPLEQRRDEIPEWTRLMVRRAHAERGGQGECTIAPDVVALLESTPWPGNLRQLDNVLRRACALASGGEHNTDVTLDDVRAALVMDGVAAERDDSFIDNLTASARAFLHLRLAGALEDGALQTQVLHSNLLFAMTWAVALDELGDDHDRIAKLIGKENSLRSRNYHKELRREMRKLGALHEAYGRTLPAEWNRYLV